MTYHPDVSRAMYHHIVSSFDVIDTFLSDAQGLLRSESANAIPIACYDALTLAYQRLVEIEPYVLEYKIREPDKSKGLYSILADLHAWAESIDDSIAISLTDDLQF